ncbi:MAG: hypothetical protein C4K58_08445 [Flavobacteriaceae bacterium]|nr:MAG: hypothetical protein C4K58_08445 [Flavobacteriaceae bacterium]
MSTEKIIDFKDFFFGSRKQIGLLIVLMVISFVGVISLQVNWLKESYENNKNQYNAKIYQSIEASVERLKRKELFKYKQEVYLNGSSLVPSLETRSPFSLQNKVEQSFKDSTQYQVSYHFDQIKNLNLRVYKTMVLALAVEEYSAKKIPIDQRINLQELEAIIQAQLKVRGVNTPFRVAILDSLRNPTSVVSKDFKSSKLNYVLPLYVDPLDRVQNYISLDIGRQNFVKINQNLLRQAILSFLYTSLILMAFVGSFYYMYNQKQISQVKTEFINNMTHEFKTPIATIQVAVGALNNEKTLSNPEKVKYFTNLIAKENSRLHTQVEMLLRMSRLEKNQIDLDKQIHEFHHLVRESIANIALVVENRGGTINTDFMAKKSKVMVDAYHLKNIILNILDNANKYSIKSPPQITIKTYNDGESIVLVILDKGMGIRPDKVKEIFNIFYRTEQGNIHDVKGYGLGLSYVKKIVEFHQGEVWVESKVDQGSSFFIKIPILV